MLASVAYKVNSVGDLGGNIGSELESVVGSAIFLKLFPKAGRKSMFFKARKIIQVSGQIHFEHILFFRVSPRYLNLKVL